jgi:acyl-CoA synthetase (AMP-forming)/AMP-acid ligase II
MQSYPDIGDIHSLCPFDFNMAEYVLAYADITPEKVALSVLSNSGARRISYAQLKSDVLGVAQGLLDTGVEPDDRVLMRLGNTVDFPITYCNWRGACAHIKRSDRNRSCQNYHGHQSHCHCS